MCVICDKCILSMLRGIVIRVEAVVRFVPFFLFSNTQDILTWWFLENVKLMMSSVVVKLARIYCCEDSNNFVVLQGCMGRNKFPKSRFTLVIGTLHRVCVFQSVDYTHLGETCKYIVVCGYNLKWSEKELVPDSIMLDLIGLVQGRNIHRVVRSEG